MNKIKVLKDTYSNDSSSKFGNKNNSVSSSLESFKQQNNTKILTAPMTSNWQSHHFEVPRNTSN